MRWQTKVESTPLVEKFRYNKRALFLGSCFALEMGQKMEQLQFNVIVNPFGTLFNPLSIATAIKRLSAGTPFTEEELFFYDGYWRSFNHSTLFSEKERTLFLKKNNAILERASEHFKNSEFVFLTLGTSWVFREVESGEVVANCHKLPSDRFVREFISYRDSFEALSPLLTPDKKWIVTVSPVRHLKDGANANQLSKANLLMVADLLAQHSSSVTYFPAYEIFMDELRDYRFYAADMVHPSTTAIEYLWERFADDFITEESIEKSKLILKLIKLKGHNTLLENESNSKILQKIVELERKIDNFIE